ncbi:HAD-IC family P-type ATPase [Rhodovarius lipocyclicus]|uniref:HAD-IC family P-type ATPase n=1 Tax=Rhodovarius lipocyclicus TaxID=268410 RepID=UPI001357DA3E|nr:HAD-IC family P-type ATPase [Rhodovarius lipocyclicus]
MTEEARPDSPSLPPGLTSAAATAALRRDGPNAVPEERPHPLRHFAARFWGPVPWMLESAIVLQLALGETTEAIVVAALLVVNAAAGALQEGRADAALEAMCARLAPQATVLRDGVWASLPVAGLVAGDVVKLGLGAVVPADVRILSGEVALDESMLTGESAAVGAGPRAAAHAGALVRGGEAVAEVTATGPRAFFGRAAELVRIARAESTQERTVVAIVRLLAVINGAVVVGMLAYAAATGMELRRVLPLVLSAVLATVPVALSLAFTLTAAMAARTLSRRGVLLTRLGAVHDAATMTVLCSDKTGTLTRNDLAIAAVAPLRGLAEADVLALAALASSDSGPDGVDAAVRAAAAGVGPSRHAAATRRAFLPFDPARRFAEAEIASPDGTQMRVVKGAPTEVAALSGAALPAEVEALARRAARHRRRRPGACGLRAGRRGRADAPSHRGRGAGGRSRDRPRAACVARADRGLPARAGARRRRGAGGRKGGGSGSSRRPGALLRARRKAAARRRRGLRDAGGGGRRPVSRRCGTAAARRAGRPASRAVRPAIAGR